MTCELLLNLHHYNRGTTVVNSFNLSGVYCIRIQPVTGSLIGASGHRGLAVRARRLDFYVVDIVTLKMIILNC